MLGEHIATDNAPEILLEMLKNQSTTDSCIYKCTAIATEFTLLHITLGYLPLTVGQSNTIRCYISTTAIGCGYLSAYETLAPGSLG